MRKAASRDLTLDVVIVLDGYRHVFERTKAGAAFRVLGLGLSRLGKCALIAESWYIVVKPQSHLGNAGLITVRLTFAVWLTRRRGAASSLSQVAVQ